MMIDLADIHAARERLRDIAIRTPLVRLNVDDVEIYLKLENLQPIGSFKLRGAGNAMALATPEELAKGVYTPSAGNMAQGVAWNARRMGIPCHAVVPDHAPQTKIDAIERLGGQVIKVPFDEWWRVMIEKHYDGLDGICVHPVSDLAVMAGNGTIGLEILEDLPDVETIIIPYGGGGLSSGIASAVRALKPDTKIFASEVETAAPLAPSLAAGEPVAVEYIPSFVDGIGSGGLIPDMWPLVSQLLDGALVMSLQEIAEAIRLLLERNRILAEGAGASSVAAAMSGKADGGKIVCVVSGGNIDLSKLTKILQDTL